MGSIEQHRIKAEDFFANATASRKYRIKRLIPFDSLTWSINIAFEGQYMDYQATRDAPRIELHSNLPQEPTRGRAAKWYG
jgi:hypothetical protein